MILALTQCAWADTPKKQVFVRVLVAEERTYLDLTVNGPVTLRSLPSGQIIRAGATGHLTATPTGFRLGKEEWAGRGFSIEPSEPRDLYLGDSRFRGSVSIFKAPNDLMYAVNRVDIEDYLYGVLHHEVAHWWPMEALKAQAVAARTYAFYQMQVSKAGEYDVKSSTSSQVYGGSTKEHMRSNDAVDRTVGQVLTYQGKVFPAYFHATCAGMTAGAKELWNIDLPPISGGVRCDYCRLSPHYYWQARVPLSTIEEKLRQNNRLIGQVLKIEPVTQTPSGRVGSIKITGTLQEAVIAAKDFRVWIGGDLMKSTSFMMAVKEDFVEFSGKGWGHGVGLCQWGALGQALLGNSYRHILGFYYPGAMVSDYRRM